MNGAFYSPEVKVEPDELNRASTEDGSSYLPTTTTATAVSPTNSSLLRPHSLDVLPDPSRAPSTTPSVKSPTAERSPPAPAKNPLSSLQAAKRKRLPQDKVGQLEDRVALDARDADAWLALIKEHQKKGKITDARNTYERFFKVFPDLVCPKQTLLIPGIAMEELCGHGTDRWRIQKGGGNLSKMSTCRLEC